MQVGLITGNLEFQCAVLIFLLSRKKGNLWRQGRQREKGRKTRGLKQVRMIYLTATVPPTEQALKHLWSESMNQLTKENGDTPEKNK